MRVYRKRSSDSEGVLAQVGPRLREQLGDYEATELSDMLVSMAQAPEAAGDMDILVVLVPEIERRFSEVSLVHAINNLWALTQLKVIHQGLLQRIAADLNTPQKVKDLPPMFMARIAWVYRRCQAWNMVEGALLPMIRAASSEFSCGDFARLAQALPEEEILLRRVADVLVQRVVEMGRKDFLFFLLGAVHGQLLEEAGRRSADSLVSEFLLYMREEQDNFKPLEIERIVRLLGYSPKYRYLLDDLPRSWDATKEQTLDYMRAKA